MNFKVIHKETVGLLLYVAGQLGVAREEREDVVQQAYLRLLEKAAKGGELTLEHAKAYLVCAVRSIVIDSKRRAKTRKTDTMEDWSAAEGRAMWSSDPEHEAMVAVAAKVLDGMAHDKATASLAWFYRDGLSVKEIQARTGEATGTITAKLCRLRRQVTPLLVKELESVPASALPC